MCTDLMKYSSRFRESCNIMLALLLAAHASQLLYNKFSHGHAYARMHASHCNQSACKFRVRTQVYPDPEIYNYMV